MNKAYIEDNGFSSIKNQKLYIACRGPQPQCFPPMANLIDWGYWRSAYAKELYDNKHNPKYLERIEEFMKEFDPDITKQRSYAKPEGGK